MDRESGAGLYLVPPGPAGTGDSGHGRGLMQLDDRTWEAWLEENDWTDPATNILKGASILDTYLGQLGQNVAAAVAAYNCGPGRIARLLATMSDAGAAQFDRYTTGHNYTSDVLARMAHLEAFP